MSEPTPEEVAVAVGAYTRAVTYGDDGGLTGPIRAALETAFAQGGRLSHADVMAVVGPAVLEAMRELGTEDLGLPEVVRFPVVTDAVATFAAGYVSGRVSQRLGEVAA